MQFFCRSLFLMFCCAMSLSAFCPNGLPNPSARFNEDCKSFDIFASCLVWTAREIGADCWAEVITTEGSSSSNELLEVNFDWDPGFRVGLGYGMGYDQWDTQAYFTWFRTKGTDRVTSSPGNVHSTFMGNFYVSNPDGSGISGPSYNHASVDWKIRFNIFDWELGRNFWVSESLALRPFLAAKGGWIHQAIHSVWQTPSFGTLPNPVQFQTGVEKLKNDFWGMGPAGGVNMKWELLARLKQSLYLFGDFSGALMWGHWSFSDVFQNDVQQKVIVNVHSVNGGAYMLRSFMGFGWNFKQVRYQFAAKLGYETQFWLDQLQFYSFTGGTLDTALTLQGGTFELSCDF